MTRLALRGVSKAYAGPVLADIDLDVRAAEVHALMGANGAGKSTLTRIVCGLTGADRGVMTLDGRSHAPASRRDAEQAGVQLVLQEPNLLDTLTVAENLFLNRLPHRFGFVDRTALHTRAAHALEAVGLAAVDPRTPVRSLGMGQRQLVDIAAALARSCRVLVLDEPTAALTAPEIARLFAHLERLRTQGIGILYISHRMDEVRRIANRVTVLRDGRIVDTRDAAHMDADTLVALMTSAVPDPRRPEAATAPAPRALPTPQSTASADVVLRVEGLRRGARVRDVTFEVRRGEILGLAGLVGSGRSETLRAIFGADRPDAGRITCRGTPLSIRSPGDAVRAGIGMVPEDRTAQALLLPLLIRANVTLASLPTLARARTWIDGTRERAQAEALTARLDVRSRSIGQPVAELSGGNQQKVVMARWLLRDCDVLLLDEPTRGIDVGTKQAIHRLLTELAARGSALVVVSSELDELMTICDRIVVISAGRVSGTFARGGWSEAGIMAAALAGDSGGRVNDVTA